MIDFKKPLRTVKRMTKTRFGFLCIHRLYYESNDFWLGLHLTYLWSSWMSSISRRVSVGKSLSEEIVGIDNFGRGTSGILSSACSMVEFLVYHILSINFYE